MIENPAWDIIKDLPGNDISLEYDKIWRPDGYQVKRMLETGEWSKDGPTRSNIVRKYTWAIPAPDSIDWIVEQLAGRAVVEIGAGTGYWAWQLALRGVAVNAYDLHPPREGYNDFHSPRIDRVSGYTDEERQEHYDRWKSFDELAVSMEEINAALEKDKRSVPMPRHKYTPLPDQDTRSVLEGIPGEHYHPIVQGGTDAATYPENADRVLFLCWPPYNTDMAFEALRAYPGDTLIFIGEGEGGCTGDEDFWGLLHKEWEHVESGPLHQWYGLHDDLDLYRLSPDRDHG